MDYALIKKAITKVTTEKRRESFMCIKVQLEYPEELVLPYKQGLALMEALESTELLTDKYSDGIRITHLVDKKVVSRLMSGEEYLLGKTATLLNVSSKELETAMLAGE